MKEGEESKRGRRGKAWWGKEGMRERNVKREGQQTSSRQERRQWPAERRSERDRFRDGGGRRTRLLLTDRETSYPSALAQAAKPLSSSPAQSASTSEPSLTAGRDSPQMKMRLHKTIHHFTSANHSATLEHYALKKYQLQRALWQEHCNNPLWQYHYTRIRLH